MPEEVTYDSDTGLIQVRAWGDDPIENWVASREKVFELHKAHGAFMLLVDVREQETIPSILDIFDFGEAWPREIRAAILIDERTSEDMSILETVAMSRARPMRMFFDEDTALQWLREGPRDIPWDTPV